MTDTQKETAKEIVRQTGRKERVTETDRQSREKRDRQRQRVGRRETDR